MHTFFTRDSKLSVSFIFFLPKFLQPAPHSSYSQQSLMLFSIAALTNQCKLKGYNNSSFLFYSSMGQKYNSGSLSQNQGVSRAVHTTRLQKRARVLAGSGSWRIQLLAVRGLRPRFPPCVFQLAPLSTS